MKTLYINISGEKVASSENLVVLGKPEDATVNKFYYELGREILRGIDVQIVSGIKKKDIVVDFKLYDEVAYNKILIQWEKLKNQYLLGERPTGYYEMLLPREYIDWLNTNSHPAYPQIAKSLYDRGCKVGINIDKMYRNIVGLIVNNIEPNDYGQFVINDNVITGGSAIVLAIQENIPNAIFVPFEEWGDGSDNGSDDGDNEYQIIAKLSAGNNKFRFIDSNGEICNPDFCETVENISYSCKCDFSNFYKKENEYFHISSEGIKCLGCFHDANLLNEDFIAVQYDRASWQVLDKNGRTVPLSCQVNKIFGINSLGYILCRLSSCEYGFIHIYSDELLKIDIDEDLENGIVMSPFSSLVVFTLDAGDFYYDFENKVLKSVHLPGYGIGVYGNDIIKDGNRRERAVYNIFGSKLAKFHWRIRDNIRGLLYGNQDENSNQIFNINTKELLPLELEYSFGDFFVASDRNEKKSLYRISNGENIISNVDEILPIMVEHGNYVLIKKECSLDLMNLDNRRKSTLISDGNLSKGYILYSYGLNLINLRVVFDDYKEISSFAFDYSGRLIIEASSDSHQMVYAVDYDTIFNLNFKRTGNNQIEVLNRDRKVLSIIPLPVNALYFDPLKKGFRLLDEDGWYYYDKIFNKAVKLPEIKKEHVLSSFCNAERYTEYDYNLSKEGIVNYRGDLICSKEKVGECYFRAFIDKSHMFDNQIIGAE